MAIPNSESECKGRICHPRNFELLSRRNLQVMQILLGAEWGGGLVTLNGTIHNAPQKAWEGWCTRSLFDQNWCRRVDFLPIISLIVKVGLCAYQPAFNCFGSLLLWREVSWDAFSRHGAVESLRCLGHCPDFYIRNYIIYYYIKYLKVLESTCCIIFCWFFVSLRIAGDLLQGWREMRWKLCLGDLLQVVGQGLVSQSCT